MRNWNRKCGNYGQLDHFDSAYGPVKLDHFDSASGQVGNLDSSNDNNSTDYSFNSTRHLKSLVQGHAQWIQSYLHKGWDGYLVTVMFNDLPGKRATKIIQMHREVTRLYGRLGKRLATWKFVAPRNFLGTFVTPPSFYPSYNDVHADLLEHI